MWIIEKRTALPFSVFHLPSYLISAFLASTSTKAVGPRSGGRAVPKARATDTEAWWIRRGLVCGRPGGSTYKQLSAIGTRARPERPAGHRRGVVVARNGASRKAVKIKTRGEGTLSLLFVSGRRATGPSSMGETGSGVTESRRYNTYSWKNCASGIILS